MSPSCAADESSHGTLLASRLQRVFAECFSRELQTRLEGGAEEPLYQPASAESEYHVLYYRADYFASALHEVAHWCIAGPQRRQRVDFGYWYAPDGRSAEQQHCFESAEYRPQALEWYFSRACAYRFRVSADNLNGMPGELSGGADFRQRIFDQALLWQRVGLPGRAATFFHALCREFGTSTPPGQLRFILAELD